MFLKTLIGLFRPRQTLKGDKRIPHRDFKGRVHYDQSKCTKSYQCVKNCPPTAIRIKKDGFIEIDHKACIRCGICTEICPEKALIMEKK